MQPETGKVKKGARRNNLIIPLLIILILMVGMVIYTSDVINRVAVANIREVGEDKISGISSQLKYYLDTTRSVLWVTADAVDYMVHNGRTTDEIEEYIVEETQRQGQQFDENYTGIYGYIMGEYLDGLRWEPPAGYDPVQRDWYAAAVEARGESTIVSPYVDAQTGAVIISISRQLSNPEDVLSMDMTMNKIQDMTEDLHIMGKGYGFIVSEDCMIIAHPDEGRKGEYLKETDEQRRFMSRVLSVRNGNFEMELDGKLRTVFVSQVMDQWYVIIAISNDELYAEHWQQLTVNVLICSVIFILIALFYYLGHKNEQNFSRRMEEMKMGEQRQAYETRVLKLEKEAADRANQAKSDFLADMSHEIRTPINAVLGMNEMIIRESTDAQEESSAEKQVEAFENIRLYAGNIESAGNNLLSIINDILDFSKIEAGRLEISESNYELSSLILDAANLVSFRAREKEIDFRVDVDEKMPNGLYGDKVRVRQIITNLLTNAVKYTDSGSIRMTVRAEEDSFVPGQGITLRITVSDTGIGIREEDMPKLFSKFQRVDLERNSTVEGTGLGLAITHSLLSMMGGKISVESVYGRGTSFTVILPQKVVSCEPVGNIRTKDEMIRSGAAVYHESFRAPDARILIVDDTRMNITVATGLLKKTQVRIDPAMSGTEALELARMNQYDLILMDQRMPGMDGTEVLRAIRSDPDGLNRNVPVICMTADAIIGAKERYIAEGFTDYLPKPVTGGMLEKTLIRYLPAGKVIPVRNDTDTEETGKNGGIGREARKDLYPELGNAGIDTEKGLSGCQNDRELYLSLLREYAAGAPEKQEKMQAFFAEENWKQYGVLVHALKSTSRLIGATALSEQAASLEKAAADGRAEEIGQKHPKMMDLYRRTAEAIAEEIAAEEKDEPENPDETVLEFFPDE